MHFYEEAELYFNYWIIVDIRCSSRRKGFYEKKKKIDLAL